jgi:opine dehydrogenase
MEGNKMAKIAIIGGGNGAHALAADCKLGGAEVRMYEFSQFTNKVRGIMNSRRVTLEGPEMNYQNFKRSGTVILDMVTHDMAEAVRGADHILVSMQAQGFEMAFRELAPLLEDGQTVSIFPGNFGSLILRRVMREMGLQQKVIIAGYATLPYGARLNKFNDFETETDVVSILYRDNVIRFDTLPSSDAEAYMALKKEIPALDATTLEHGDTVLDIGLSNVNPLLHVPATILNTGAIENWGIIPGVGEKDLYFDIYAHGVSPSVGRVQYQFYKEMSAIAKAYGVGICEVDEDALQSRMGIIGQLFYGSDFRQPFSEPLDTDNWLNPPKGARFDLNSRYITEDVPVGCCTSIHFASLLNVPTPALSGMTDLANIMLDTDFYKTGFTLDLLGLGGMTPEEMVKYMRTGAYEK